MFLFPPVPKHKISNQFDKVREELQEIEDAPDRFNMVEEYWDTVHALEQIGREIARKVGSQVFYDGKDIVLEKNFGRGLYCQK